jgi:hypothetical protein
MDRSKKLILLFVSFLIVNLIFGCMLLSSDIMVTLPCLIYNQRHHKLDIVQNGEVNFAEGEPLCCAPYQHKREM